MDIQKPLHSLFIIDVVIVMDVHRGALHRSRFAFMVLHKYPPDLSDSYNKMGSPTFSMQSDTFEFFMILVIKLGKTFLFLVSHSSSLP